MLRPGDTVTPDFTYGFIWSSQTMEDDSAHVPQGAALQVSILLPFSTDSEPPQDLNRGAPFPMKRCPQRDTDADADTDADTYTVDIAANCTDSCIYANDGQCDDGQPGSDTTLCSAGTDCTDCGARFDRICDETCEHAGCSGVLIGPRLVLTAAHCVDGETLPSGIVRVDAAVGADSSEPTAVATVTAVLLHPDYVREGPEGPAHDLALLALHSPLTTEGPCISGKPLTERDAGRQFTGYGYGTAGWFEWDTRGRQRGATFEVGHVAEALVSRAEDNPNDASLCTGDSGGPLFAGDVVVGIHSWAEDLCASYSGFTDVGGETAWVLDGADQLQVEVGCVDDSIPVPPPPEGRAGCTSAPLGPTGLVFILWSALATRRR